MTQFTTTERLQKTFSSDYASALKQRVKDNHIDHYFEDNFEIEENGTNVYKLQGVLTRHVVLDAEKSDFENAISLYEGLSGVTPLIASEEAFWMYLTHVEYFDYVKTRWFKKGKEDTTVSTIKKRFFYNGSAMDNALSRLWWSVYLTKDDDLEDPYRYTKVILKEGNSDLLQNLSKSRLYRLRDAVHGILKFFSEYDERKDFSAVNRHIVQYFNRYSGVKQLVYMNESFFYATAIQALAFYKAKHKIND